MRSPTRGRRPRSVDRRPLSSSSSLAAVVGRLRLGRRPRRRLRRRRGAGVRRARGTVARGNGVRQAGRRRHGRHGRRPRHRASAADGDGQVAIVDDAKIVRTGSLQLTGGRRAESR